MSSEADVAQTTASTAADLISKMFSGGPESVIAVLILVVAVCLIALYLLYKRSNEKDKIIDSMIENTQKLHDANREQYTEMVDRYIELVEDINKRHADETRLTNEALNSVKISLTEIRAVVSITRHQ